jgi:Zn-dependent M28 family amino/carboxypeptidase
MESANLIVVHPGLSEQQIIVGAHYDSGDEADGADDNASGVAVLLEVAGLVAEVETPYTIVFIAFGAEENDLDGSRYYVNEMSSSEVANTIAMITLASLIAGDLAYVYGDAGPGTLRDWIRDLAASADNPLEGKTAAEMDNDVHPCECADYHAFQQAGIPCLFRGHQLEPGQQDGMTQVDQYGDGGEVRHTVRYLEYIERPSRSHRHHLQPFVTLLFNTCKCINNWSFAFLKNRR